MQTEEKNRFEVIGVFRNVVVACATIFMLAACQSLGPSAVRVGMPEYNLAINETSDQIMLLNFVRIRYSESPTIVYTPVGGEQFSTRLLEPVGLHTIGLLSQGG